MKSSKNMSLAAGLVIGVGVGIALDNIGLGMALGLLFGAALGRRYDGQNQAEDPPEGE